MPKTIWKYTLQPEGSIEIPKDAELLTVAEQYGEICLWALVEPTAPRVERSFVSFGTGHDVPDDNLSYVGSAQLQGGALVFHVFEKY